MEVTLTGSAGDGGINRDGDVRAVQELLNRVGADKGGAMVRLDVDGIVGPRTIAAIRRFQSINLGFEDGRVDPGGPTLAKLNELADGVTPPESSLVAWGAVVSGEFKTAVTAIAGRLGTNPDNLMAAMAFETGETFDPSIRNRAGSGAVGLIQFMPKTAINLGTTVDTLAEMTAVEQLNYVEQYLRPYAGRIGALDDVYMAIFWPAAIGKSADTVLINRNSQSTAYSQNRGLDADDDGKITKGEAAARVRASLTRGLSAGRAG